MRRVAIAGLVLLLLACSSGAPRRWPLAMDLARTLHRSGLCAHPRLNEHRRREVLCARRPDGGRTGVATFPSQRSTLRSIAMARASARFVGCDLHASGGAMTIVVGPHFTVVGSDRPRAVARVLGGKVSEPPARCRPTASPVVR